MALLAAGSTVPLFIDSTAWALADPLDLKNTQQASGADGKVLVVVQLSGGNDGLNTVVPYADDAYHAARPQLGKKPADVLKLNDYVGLHPSLAPLKQLHDDGQLALIQGVGYPNPNRSHFRSMDIWQTADTEDAQAATGWLGRYFDNQCAGADDPTVGGGGSDAALSGVSLAGAGSLAMKGARVQTLAFENPDQFRYTGKPGAERYKTLNQVPATKPAKRDGHDELASFLGRTALDAQLSSDRVRAAADKFAKATTGDYPGGEFGKSLQTVAQLIAGGLPTRVYYVSLGGFDTHANQVGAHDRLMDQLGKGVGAFWHDLKQLGLADRVLMLTFSEFGRRVAQNASNGTDHGAAAPMFLIGPRVDAGLHGKHPSLVDLDAGDLKHSVDFRAVYASVLQGWLDAPSKPILGKQFPTMRLVKG